MFEPFRTYSRPWDLDEAMRRWSEELICSNLFEHIRGHAPQVAGADLFEPFRFCFEFASSHVLEFALSCHIRKVLPRTGIRVRVILGRCSRVPQFA